MENQNTKSKEGWKEHERQMANMRKRRCIQFGKVVKDLRKMGFEVERISGYQFRINEVLDIFPANKIFHDRKNYKKGKVQGQDLRSFIKNYFGIK